ncbi:hypothetical protein VCH24_00140 [Variovorax boronicumulans]|nr:hypothetical protein VCH24_00140 [Variovorax boronicumulans]
MLLAPIIDPGATLVLSTAGFHMDGEAFLYSGRSGLWVCTVFRTRVDGAFYATADISLGGEQQCKLALNLPDSTDSASVESLKKRCLAWIQQAESATSKAEDVFFGR